VVDFLKEQKDKKLRIRKRRRARFAEGDLANRDDRKGDGKAKEEASEKKRAFDEAFQGAGPKQYADTQSGKLGVDLSIQVQNLRNQNRLDQDRPAQFQAATCLESAASGIDEGFDAKMTLVTVKAQTMPTSASWKRHNIVKDVYRLGNHIVWVTPSGTALVIDSHDGKTALRRGD